MREKACHPSFWHSTDLPLKFIFLHLKSLHFTSTKWFSSTLAHGQHHALFMWTPASRRSFFFFIFKKIKISKIYFRFGKFQKYTPVALWGATGLKCNFFSSNLQRSPWRKKRGGMSPPQRAIGPCRPPQGRQGPVARWGGDRVPISFCHLSLKIQEKREG